MGHIVKVVEIQAGVYRDEHTNKITIPGDSETSCTVLVKGNAAVHLGSYLAVFLTDNALRQVPDNISADTRPARYMLNELLKCAKEERVEVIMNPSQMAFLYPLLS